MEDKDCESEEGEQQLLQQSTNDKKRLRSTSSMSQKNEKPSIKPNTKAALSKALDNIPENIQHIIENALVPLFETITALKEDIVALKTTLEEVKTSAAASTNNSNPWGKTGIPCNTQVSLHDFPMLNQTKGVSGLNKPPPVNKAFELANKCLGFAPITRKDVEDYEQKFDYIPNLDERFQHAAKLAIRHFFYNELKLDDQTIDDIPIISAFYADGRAKITTLYAEFANAEDMRMVRKNARFLKSSEDHKPKISPFVPKSIMARYLEVEKKAFEIRSEDKQIATKIWINDDVELRTKNKSDSTPWTLVPITILENLPPQAPRKTTIRKEIRIIEEVVASSALPENVPITLSSDNEELDNPFVTEQGSKKKSPPKARVCPSQNASIISPNTFCLLENDDQS